MDAHEETNQSLTSTPSASEGTAPEQPRASATEAPGHDLPMPLPVDELQLRACLTGLDAPEIRSRVLAAWTALAPWQWHELGTELLDGLEAEDVRIPALMIDLALSTARVSAMDDEDLAALFAWTHTHHPRVLLGVLAPHRHAVQALALTGV